MQFVQHTISCIHSENFKEQSTETENPWSLSRDCISSADACRSKEKEISIKRPLREKNPKNVFKHVPHKEKAPQVVARRNARERRRVQAVNMAFVRLRKAIPYQNSRGKRISKVKTLHNAIRYIQELEIILQDANIYDSFCINERYCNVKYTNVYYETSN